MSKSAKINRDTLDWLLEPADVGVRYLALRDLTHARSKELAEASEAAHASGPIARVLAKVRPEGYWVQPGPGYYPKYTGTVWSLIVLAQLGASVKADERVAKACSYILDHALTEDGHVTINGLASGTADCLQGNLCAALLDLGCKDQRLDTAFEWMARSVTGDGVAPMQEKTARLRYYAGKCGPRFACGANNKQSCAWGAVKVVLALGKLAKHKRTRLIENAIETGIDFLLGTDPVKANYPCGYSTKPSGNWWKFGFPVFYVTDLLQNVQALVGVGRATDPRLQNALKFIQEKQDSEGRWLLEYDYASKTWVDWGAKHQPNKWVTLRALNVLKQAAV